MRPGMMVHAGPKRSAAARTPSEPAIYEVGGTSVKRSSRDRAGLVKSRAGGSSPLLAGPGGVGLERPDAFGERATALGKVAIGGSAVGDAVGGFGRLGRDYRFRCQHGLDRRIRSLQCHRQLGDFGGDVVDAL